MMVFKFIVVYKLYALDIRLFNNVLKYTTREAEEVKKDSN